MDIAEWRLKIDELDRQLVGLINERARCAEEIGKLKRNSSIPIYERLVDVMRQIQRDEMAPDPVAERSGEPTELEPND